MTEEFFKFPSTPHLALLGDVAVRGDKVFSEHDRDNFLKNTITVEEKLDGANLGISFDRDSNMHVQNRGSYIDKPYSGQWKELGRWIPSKRDLMFDVLTDRYILFGEWCYAVHSIYYDQLPDLFLGFDIFDKKNKKFLSCKRRDKLFHTLGISQVPLLKRSRFTFDYLLQLLEESRFSENPAEGLYLRFDYGDWLCQRAKLVRPEFIQTIEEHWTKKGLRANKIGRELHV